MTVEVSVGVLLAGIGRSGRSGDSLPVLPFDLLLLGPSLLLISAIIAFPLRSRMCVWFSVILRHILVARRLESFRDRVASERRGRYIDVDLREATRRGSGRRRDDGGHRLLFTVRANGR